jgi:NAD-dependent deacetylase sirtuin 5
MPSGFVGLPIEALSGIPTFRGAGGMWRSLNAMSLATPEAFARDPSLVWQFYHYRREKYVDRPHNGPENVLMTLQSPSVTA